MRKQLFKTFHATRRNIIKIMFLIKFQEYFEKMYSCSRAYTKSDWVKCMIYTNKNEFSIQYNQQTLHQPDNLNTERNVLKQTEGG